MQEIIKFEKLILIGKFQRLVSSNKELDFVVVIKDDTNKFEFVKQTESLAIQYISNYKFMFQFFPIHDFDFNSESNAFIRSVQKKGIEI